MKKVIISFALMVFLSACAIGKLDNSPQDQVARLDAAYVVAIETLKVGRAPCVDDIKTNDDQCLINDALFAEISVWVSRADRALREAEKYAARQDVENMNEMIAKFKEDFTNIENIVSIVKGKM